MNSQHLTTRQIAILASLQTRANGTLEKLPEQAIKGTLSIEQIQPVCRALNDEYLMRGIKENYDPNAYGEELESLPDQINRPHVLGPDIGNERIAGQ